MLNTSFNVSHDGVNVDVEYMLILYKSVEGNWTIDTLDPCGMTNLSIPSMGIKTYDSEEVTRLLDTIKGTTQKDYENEINDLVEDTIRNYTQGELEDLVMTSLELKCN